MGYYLLSYNDQELSQSKHPSLIPPIKPFHMKYIYQESSNILNHELRTLCFLSIKFYNYGQWRWFRCLTPQQW